MDPPPIPALVSLEYQAILLTGQNGSNRATPAGDSGYADDIQMYDAVGGFTEREPAYGLDGPADSDSNEETPPQTAKKRRTLFAASGHRKKAALSGGDSDRGPEMKDIGTSMDDTHMLDARDEGDLGYDLDEKEIPLTEGDDVVGFAAPVPQVSRITGVQIPPLSFAKSQYTGYDFGMAVEKEYRVIKTLLVAEDEPGTESEASEGDFSSFQLEKFTMYRPPGGEKYSGEMTTLSYLNVKPGIAVLFFDGILTDGKTRHYLQGVPFSSVSVGNYESKGTHDVSRNIWIQTKIAREHNAWYELTVPSEEYARYWEPFVWLANFSKHVIDYMSEHGSVILSDFKSDFIGWLRIHHSESRSFQTWHAMYGRDDYRQPVAVHRDWLWNQVSNGSAGLNRSKLWDEVQHLCAIKPVNHQKEDPTVVTQWVYNCFEHMFGNGMKVVKPVPQNVGATLKEVAIFAPTRVARDGTGNISQAKIKSVEPGQVVAIKTDSMSDWEGKAGVWYAYVQRVRSVQVEKRSRRHSQEFKTALDVIWLYAPEDTILAKGKYMHQNELFFSDHCNCGDMPIGLEDVINTISVEFNVGPGESGKEYFVRQKYRTADPAFLTLTKADMKSCACLGVQSSAYQEVENNFSVGDTVLVGCNRGDKDALEPAVIIRLDGQSEMVHIRALERRSRFNQHARPNELLWTPLVLRIAPAFVFRRCHVKFIPAGDVKAGKIPVPYDRDGTGDCFFISSCLEGDREIKPFARGAFPASLKEGYCPMAPLPNKSRMRGMDLFCGGGNFGRGIEEGGVIDMKWAVDLDHPAMASYRANLREGSQDAGLYLGSVNNYMESAIRGKHSDTVARPGQVEFISAGSPCQGFSNANQWKNSEGSIRNCSLVASVATAVDVYRPLYALLENVSGMASTRRLPNGVEVNVFAQLLCCIVGMGYQTQQFTLDSWSFGSPQSRTRLFLNIAAPGQALPPRPPRSHDHGPAVKSRALFAAPNGDQFAGREMSGPCPFQIVTFRKRAEDLPKIHDGQVGVCISYPDHRFASGCDNVQRSQMAQVPKWGPKKSWRYALNTGRMHRYFAFTGGTNKLKQLPNCRSWSRVEWDGLCRTITTSITPQCAFTGTWIHPLEDRLLTVMEARRAQSFPDDEVLIGSATQAFKIVGNSVSRSVALAWGIVLRYAYLEENNILRR